MGARIWQPSLALTPPQKKIIFFTFESLKIIMMMMMMVNFGHDLIWLSQKKNLFFFFLSFQDYSSIITGEWWWEATKKPKSTKNIHPKARTNWVKFYTLKFSNVIIFFGHCCSSYIPIHIGPIYSNFSCFLAFTFLDLCLTMDFFCISLYDDQRMITRQDKKNNNKTIYE